MKRDNVVHGVFVWGSAAILLAAAIFVRNHQIDQIDVDRPIEVRGTVGQRLAGRDIVAEVVKVWKTERVMLDWADNRPDLYRPHNGWVFVFVEILAETRFTSSEVRPAVTFGDLTFAAKYLGYVPRDRLIPGIPSESRFGFELPKSVAASTVEVNIVASRDPRRDSSLVFTTDLDAAQEVSQYVVDKKKEP